ncbi:TlpA family protein disulfide reductase [Ramlibacter rhizophilus]|uniref:TlpA family protein disulfide reductase n=1 Tax=Ramlibacter rhizophilus TaxID=1781167 RepID=A0A4Z0BU69_9BURK|nr:TlpA disulfide reductase family protein [Ramlibacter rhizophilus]TFZ01545.1 TlpA family protein disulfide reductase [Ramlibacter rhizophilus]
MARPESRRGLLFAGVAALAGLAGGGLAWWRFRDDSPADERIAPTFWSLRFPTPQDGELRMDAFRGRPLLVNFWATWCPPCVEEMPLLDRFHREHAAAGWQVVGVAVDQAPAVRQFLGRTPVGFPIALAGLDGASLGRDLGNRVGGLPFTVLIGPDGRILQRRIGQLSADELARWRSASTG